MITAAENWVHQWGAPSVVAVIIIGAVGLYFTARTFANQARESEQTKQDRWKAAGDAAAVTRLQPVINDLKAQIDTLKDVVARRDRTIELKDARYDRMQERLQDRINELQDQLRGIN